MTLLNLIILELLSGVLLTLAIPNQFLQFGSVTFGLIALIPHFIALENSKSLRQSFILCAVQSITVHVLSSFWLAYFKDYAIFTLGASALGTAFIHGMFSYLFYLPKFAKSRLLKSEFASTRILNSTPFKVFWYAAVYTVWEFIKSRGFLAYPWGTIPMTAYHLKLITQIVDITGVRGITFLFSFFASLAAFFVMDAIKYDVKAAFRLNKKTLSALLLLFMLSTIYGTYQYTKLRIPVKHINTIMIQQNYDPWKQKDDSKTIYDSQRLTLKGVEELNNDYKKPDLVVWSEGVLHYPFPLGYKPHYQYFPELNPLIPFMQAVKATTIIGAPYVHNLDEYKFSNSALIFDKNGNLQDYYAKIHLVPFAEHIPFAEHPLVRKLLQGLIGFSVGWVPGWEFKVFPVELSDYPGQTANISIPICFEDAFGDVFAGLKKLGTDVFVNITDDSWSLTTSAEYQHFVISWFRSMEFRTTMVRSTNSGYTIVEDPSGRIQYELPLFVQDELSCSIPVYKNYLTTYAVFGEWLCSIFLVIILLVLIYIIFYNNNFFLTPKFIQKYNSEFLV